MKKLYHIEGLHCNGCVNAMKTILSGDENIVEMDVDLEKKEVMITSKNPVDMQACNELMDIRGFVLTDI